MKLFSWHSSVSISWDLQLFGNESQDCLVYMIYGTCDECTLQNWLYIDRA